MYITPSCAADGRKAFDFMWEANTAVIQLQLLKPPRDVAGWKTSRKNWRPLLTHASFIEALVNMDEDSDANTEFSCC